MKARGNISAGVIFGSLVLAMQIGYVASCKADDLPIDAFFGTYQGEAVHLSGGMDSRRVIHVSIGPTEQGFNVTWSTETWSAQTVHGKKTYSIDFEASDRPNIFRSLMRKNMFGGRVPRDPLKGEPYVWARIVDRTFTVYALLITGDGSYEMQVYDRTLDDGGIDLKFSRFREGEAVRTLSAWCERTGPHKSPLNKP